LVAHAGKIKLQSKCASQIVIFCSLQTLLTLIRTKDINHHAHQPSTIKLFSKPFEGHTRSYQYSETIAEMKCYVYLFTVSLSVLLSPTRTVTAFSNNLQSLLRQSSSAPPSAAAGIRQSKSARPASSTALCTALTLYGSQGSRYETCMPATVCSFDLTSHSYKMITKYVLCPLPTDQCEPGNH